MKTNLNASFNKTKVTQQDDKTRLVDINNNNNNNNNNNQPTNQPTTHENELVGINQTCSL